MKRGSWHARRLRAAVARVTLGAMLSRIVVAAFLIAFAIFAAVRIYWTDIVAQPASAAAFLGALAGAGGGLLAIIMGALLNAELNRRRDDRLLEQEKKAVAIEIQGDLVALRLLATAGLDVVDQILSKSSQMAARSLGMMALPPQDFLERAPGRLGLLGPDVAIHVLVAHTGANSFRYKFQSLLVYGPDRPIPRGELESLRGSYVSLVRGCERAIDALENVTGRKIRHYQLPTDEAGTADSKVKRPEVSAK